MKNWKNSHQSKEQKPGWLLSSVTIFKMRKPNCCFLSCFVVCCNFFLTRSIYNIACIILQGCLWGPGRMFILVSLINHFPGRISGASGEGGEGGGGVPAVPPLWPLTAPSNERRHSHTDVLTPFWSPFFPFLLPFPLATASLLAVSQLKLCTRECFCLLPRSKSSSAFSLPLVSSVSGSLTSAIPHLPLSGCPLLIHCPLLFRTQHTLQKTTIKQTFLLVSLKSGTAQWLYGIYKENKLWSTLQHL